MSEKIAKNPKIDERLPQRIGTKVYQQYAAVKSPWEKLVGYREMMHYVSRYNNVISAAVAQGFKILIPDYKGRTSLMCEEAYQRWIKILATPGAFLCKENMRADLNMHPFCRGNFVGGLRGDDGDETLMMCGRVNDFGTYRVEKELDVCDWDICGSDLCRATTASLQGMSDGAATGSFKGPNVEYCMVEAKGCGDRHCRIVAENREKYPMPEHEIWETFGPVATMDQIKFTPDEECISESMVFRRECDYRFANGTNKESDDSSISNVASLSCAATGYYLPAIQYAIDKGRINMEMAEHVLKCCCEAAGKAAYGQLVTREGLRQWMGIPRSIGDDDARVMGGMIEMYLQGGSIPYEIEEFNNKTVVFIMERKRILANIRFVDCCLIPYWYGASKTLINAQWALWEEDSPENKLRIKIAKKIDKFC